MIDIYIFLEIIYWQYSGNLLSLQPNSVFQNGKLFEFKK